MRTLTKLYLVLGLVWVVSAVAGFALYRGGNVVCGSACGAERFTFWNNFYSDLGNVIPYHDDAEASRLRMTRPLFILNGVLTSLMVFLAAAIAAASEPVLMRALTVGLLSFGFVAGAMLTVGAPSDADQYGHRAGVAVSTLCLAGLAWSVSVVYQETWWRSINTVALLGTLLYLTVAAVAPLNDVQLIMVQRGGTVTTLLNLGYLVWATLTR